MAAEFDEKLLEKIGRFPISPGVYIMKDARSRILYIGKAVNLRNRVRSYFGRSSDTRVFHRLLVEKAADVDCIVAESEAEALILENNLIKKHRPLYNIRLKDDKTYVSIKVTVAEEWPRVLVVRRYRKDGNLYFGPYGSARAVREMLGVIKKVFPLRTCSDGFFRGRQRPCIEHEIDRCCGPCAALVSREEYMEHVQQVILFLKGRNKELERRLEAKMREAAEARQYEIAGRFRDQIRAIGKVFETQKAQEFRLGDLDVFAAARQGDRLAVQELVVRDGKIVNSRCHTFSTQLETAEILSSFILQYYLHDRFVPPELLVGEEFPDRALVETCLAEKRGGRVRVAVPRRGDKAGLVELARKNARNSFDLETTRAEQHVAIQASLARHLGLPDPPRRIECYDISSFQGSLAVGAMVAFEDGEPDKDSYRKYRIQTALGADDFECIREVLSRRLARGREEENLPDLIVIDGGKGQLHAALEVFRALGIEGVGLISLAKERRRKGTFERIFAPGRADPLALEQDSPESLYIQRIRDEAHRFAVGYHRELRKRQTLRTGLEDIEGIGPKRRQALIDRFGTLRKIRAATAEEIAEVVGARLAQVVRERLATPPSER
ncbi:MAG: excinuclease ABC subunit UvrC [Planctomycetes bacterium]|nr:excinuclease ABC subunit UvrC [Planctomycetota bacterium]